MRVKSRVGAEWTTPSDFNWQHVSIEVLMDVRDELRKLNALLHCHNFISIPTKLTRISRNTAKPRKPANRKKKPG